MSIQSDAKIYETFSNWLNEQTTQVQENMKSLKKDGSRDWYNPKSNGGENTSVLKPADICKRFPYDEFNDHYLTLMNGEYIVSDSIVLKQQYAAVRSSERAFRLRHATPARLLAHTANDLAQIGNKLYEGGFRMRLEKLIDTGKKQLAEKLA